MKRNRLIPALILLVLLAAMLLHGCQSAATTATANTTPTIQAGTTEGETVQITVPKATEAATTEPEPPATDTGSTPVAEVPTEDLTEAKPTEPTPTEPKPTDPTPTEPAPTEPKPTEPKPTEPKPTEPTPTNPKPTEPAPTEPQHTHSWSAWTQTKAPTCNAAGEEARTCNCGAKETRPVSATGNHTWTETAPTCTQAGLKTCTVCGKTEPLAALGHTWVHHDEEGHTEASIKCYCGMVFSSEGEWWNHVMQYDDTEEMDNHAGHTDVFSWVVDTPAYDVCSRCGTMK